jgi:hypothetical protein
MKNLVILVVLGLAVWQGYSTYQDHFGGIASSSDISDSVKPANFFSDEENSGHNFHCDGRTYCSQMNSCAEATFFIRNCPGVKMDGNRDGVPCEKQWCR